MVETRTIRTDPPVRANRSSLAERSTKGLGRSSRYGADPDRPYATQSTTKLIKRVGELAVELVKKEAALARQEFRADLGRELGAVKLLSVAGIFGLATIQLLLVAAVFALARAMPGRPEWVAALWVAAGTLVVAGILFAIGWARRVRKPMERTQEQLQEDVRWVRDRLP